MSDVTCDSVEFKNFMSFGNLPTVVKLDGIGTTLIMGENLDDGGSSGAGKTTVFSAVSYALFGKIPSKVSKDKLINQTNDKKSTSMDVVFNFKRNNKTYKVTRRRGAEDFLQLCEDGIDITPASASAFNAKVQEVWGKSFALTSLIMFFNGSSRPFLDFTVSEQRGLIEELLGITVLSRKAKALKTRVNQTDKDIEVQKALLQQQLKQNEGYRKRLTEAKDRVVKWESQRVSSIQKCQDDLEVLSGIDFDTEEQLLNELTKLQTSLIPFQSETKEIETRLRAKERDTFSGKSDITIITSTISKQDGEVEKIKKDLDHLSKAKCPFCLQKFEDSAAKIDELQAKQQILSEEIISNKQKLEKLLSDQELFNASKQTDINELTIELKNKKQQSASLLDSIEEIKSAMKFSSQKEITTAKNNIDTIKAQIDKLYGEENPHTESVSVIESEGEATIDDKKLEELIKLQEHQQFLVKLLLDKNSFIRKNIISKNIPFLNKRISQYTQDLSLPHIVLFQSDMSCEISQYGRELDHGNLSNGEKKRLNLALCLAFRDIDTYLNSKINILFTDEIDGGSLDGLIVDSLIHMLKRKAWDDKIGIYIISHRPEFDGRCDRNLIVRKERGFSSLITQPEM